MRKSPVGPAAQKEASTPPFPFPASTSPQARARVEELAYVISCPNSSWAVPLPAPSYIPSTQDPLPSPLHLLPPSKVPIELGESLSDRPHALCAVMTQEPPCGVRGANRPAKPPCKEECGVAGPQGPTRGRALKLKLFPVIGRTELRNANKQRQALGMGEGRRARSHGCTADRGHLQNESGTRPGGLCRRTVPPRPEPRR